MVISMRESVVDRYVKRATANMHQNNCTYISCPCRRCRLGCMFEPSSGKLQEHLLMRGFMDGHTQWMSDDEDDHGVVSGGRRQMEMRKKGSRTMMTTKRLPYMMMEINLRVNNM